MKKKLLLILMMITIFTTGCNKLSESEDFVQGQEKLESHQYNEALTLLSQVLNEDPDNSSARSMYMQARKMQSAQEYENNQDYIRAIRELETIVNINDGSKQIKREAINKKAELENLQKQKEEAIEENTKEPVINQQETINTEEKVDVNVENKVETKNIEESN